MAVGAKWTKDEIIALVTAGTVSRKEHLVVHRVNYMRLFSYVTITC